MKLSLSIIFLVVKILAGPAPKEGEFNRRACTVGSCTCIPGTFPGLYCGFCNQVLPVMNQEFDNAHVYQCSPNGDCCDYGFRTSCGNGEGPCGDC